MSEKKEYVRLGTVLVNSEGNHYIKLNQERDKDGNPKGTKVFPITLGDGTKLNEGDTISLYSKDKQFNDLVSRGRMTREQADELLSFLRYDVVYTKKAGSFPEPAQEPGKSGKGKGQKSKPDASVF